MIRRKGEAITQILVAFVLLQLPLDTLQRTIGEWVSDSESSSKIYYSNSPQLKLVPSQLLFTFQMTIASRRSCVKLY